MFIYQKNYLFVITLTVLLLIGNLSSSNTRLPVTVPNGGNVTINSETEAGEGVTKTSEDDKTIFSIDGGSGSDAMALITMSGGITTVEENIELKHLYQEAFYGDGNDIVKFLGYNTEATVVNYGIFDSAGMSATGAILQNYRTWGNKNIINYGNITGLTRVLYFHNAGPNHMVLNFGTITAIPTVELSKISAEGERAIQFWGRHRNSILTNYGEISATQSAIFYANGLGGSVMENYGTIRGVRSIVIQDCANSLFINYGNIDEFVVAGATRLLFNNYGLIGKSFASRQSYGKNYGLMAGQDAVKLFSSIFENHGEIKASENALTLSSNNFIINKGTISHNSNYYVVYSGGDPGTTFEKHNSFENYGTIKSTGIYVGTIHLGVNGLFYTAPTNTIYTNVNVFVGTNDTTTVGIYGYCLAKGDNYTVTNKPNSIFNQVNNFQQGVIPLAGDGIFTLDDTSPDVMYEINNLRGNLTINYNENSPFNQTIYSILGGSVALVVNTGYIGESATFTFNNHDADEEIYPRGADKISFLNAGNLKANVSNVAFFFHGVNDGTYGGDITISSYQKGGVNCGIFGIANMRGTDLIVTAPTYKKPNSLNNIEYFKANVFSFGGSENFVVQTSPDSNGWMNQGEQSIDTIDFSYFSGKMHVSSDAVSTSNVNDGTILIKDNTWQNMTLQTSISTDRQIEINGGSLVGVNFYDGENTLILHVNTDNTLPNIGNVNFITNINHYGVYRAGTLQLLNENEQAYAIDSGAFASATEYYNHSTSLDYFDAGIRYLNLEQLSLKGKFSLSQNFSDKWIGVSTGSYGTQISALRTIQLLSGELSTGNFIFTKGSKLILKGSVGQPASLRHSVNGGDVELGIGSTLIIYENANIGTNSQVKSLGGILELRKTTDHTIHGSNFQLIANIFFIENSLKSL